MARPRFHKHNVTSLCAHCTPYSPIHPHRCDAGCIEPPTSQHPSIITDKHKTTPIHHRRRRRRNDVKMKLVGRSRRHATQRPHNVSHPHQRQHRPPSISGPPASCQPNETPENATTRRGRNFSTPARTLNAAIRWCYYTWSPSAAAATAASVIRRRHRHPRYVYSKCSGVLCARLQYLGRTFYYRPISPPRQTQCQTPAHK